MLKSNLKKKKVLKKFWIRLFIQMRTEVSCLYSGPRPILHLTFMEICLRTKT